MSDISSQENDNSLVEESASFRQPVDDSEITERYRFFFFPIVQLLKFAHPVIVLSRNQ